MSTFDEWLKSAKKDLALTPEEEQEKKAAQAWFGMVTREPKPKERPKLTLIQGGMAWRRT